MATPKHYTSHHMLEAAFKYRKAELWNLLSDSDIFAVTLPSGEIGYCITMGGGGTYYGLGMYRGKKGFSTFLRMIDHPDNQVDAMAAYLTYDVINCNFSQANEMNFNIKEPVREFSKKFGFPIPKKKGWPEFVRYQPFHESAPVDNQQDGDDMATALFAGVYLAKLLKEKTFAEIGFDEDDDYPTNEGGKVVPLLVDDGAQKFHLETTTLPALEPFEYPRPNKLNEGHVEEVKTKQKRGSVEIGTLAMPGVLFNNPTNMAMIMIPILYKESGMISAAPCTCPYDLDPDDLLNRVVDQIIVGDHIPATVICTDELTACMMEAFCEYTGIKLKRSRKSPAFMQAAQGVFNAMTMGF